MRVGKTNNRRRDETFQGQQRGDLHAEKLSCCDCIHRARRAHESQDLSSIVFITDWLCREPGP
jgi:hypothetical protein